MREALRSGKPLEVGTEPHLEAVEDVASGLKSVFSAEGLKRVLLTVEGGMVNGKITPTVIASE